MATMPMERPQLATPRNPLVIAGLIIIAALAAILLYQSWFQPGVGTMEFTSADTSAGCEWQILFTPKIGNSFGTKGVTLGKCTPEVQKNAIQALLEYFTNLLEKGERNPDWWVSDGNVIDYLSRVYNSIPK